jgi:hypothetical protein
VSPDSVDLLKSAESDITNGVFTFDGKSVAHDVTDDVSFGAEALSSRFTFATWMKHDQEDDEQVKQHVVCSADAEGECFVTSKCYSSQTFTEAMPDRFILFVDRFFSNKKSVCIITSLTLTVLEVEASRRNIESSTTKFCIMLELS